MVIHKMVISVMDNGQIEVAGIPENLEVALLLIHNLTRMVVGFHLDKEIRQRAILQYKQHETDSVLIN